MPKKKKMAKETRRVHHVRGVSKEHRGFEILLERVRDDIQLVAEQHGGIIQKLDDHGRKLDEHGRILKMHTEMLGAIRKDAEVIKTDVEFLKGALKKKVDYEEFQALARRVAVLEKRR